MLKPSQVVVEYDHDLFEFGGSCIDATLYVMTKDGDIKGKISVIMGDEIGDLRFWLHRIKGYSLMDPVSIGIAIEPHGLGKYHIVTNGKPQRTAHLSIRSVAVALVRMWMKGGGEL